MFNKKITFHACRMQLSLPSSMKHVILLLLLVILSESGWSQEVKYTEFKYENGVVSSEGNMVNGQPEGYWNTFYENGTVKSEGNRKDHLLDGLWKFYATNGTITQSIEYAKGKKNGTSTKHYEDGVVEKTEQFISDVKVGEIRRFHPSGSLMAIIPMDTLGKGREHGKGYEFSDGDERIIAVTEFRNGFVGSRERINRKDKFNQKQGLWREFYEDRSVSL